MAKGNYEKLRETLIESSHRLICAALEKCESEELIYDAIYNAVISTKLKYKKIINKDITVELCISLIKKPKKRSKKEFDSVEECINRAIDDFAVRKKPIITAVSIILLAAMIIPTLITGGVIYIQSRGFTMEGSVALGNNMKGNDTMIKNFSEIGVMGAPSMKDRTGVGYRLCENGWDGHRGEYETVSTKNGDIYLAQIYYSEDPLKSEFILYKAEEDGWDEMGRADTRLSYTKGVIDGKYREMYSVSELSLFTDDKDNVYVLTENEMGLQVHKCTKKGDFSLIDTFFISDAKDVSIGSAGIVSNTIAYYNDIMINEKKNSVEIYYRLASDTMLGIDKYYFVSFDIGSCAFTEGAPAHDSLNKYLMTSGVSLVAYDGDGGFFVAAMYYYRNKDGILFRDWRNYCVIHIKDSQVIEEMVYYESRSGGGASGTNIGPSMVGYYEDKVHLVFSRTYYSLGNQSVTEKWYVQFDENREQKSRYKLKPMTLDDHSTQFFFMRDGEIYWTIIAVDEWLVIGRIVDKNKTEKIAEIKIPLKGTAAVYLHNHRGGLFSDDGSIDLVFSEYGEAKFVTRTEDAYFGQLIIDFGKE